MVASKYEQSIKSTFDIYEIVVKTFNQSNLIAVNVRLDQLPIISISFFYKLSRMCFILSVDFACNYIEDVRL